MAKFGQNDDRILFPRNWAEWIAIFRDDREYDVVVQPASHF
jgi:hypothetical protein